MVFEQVSAPRSCKVPSRHRSDVLGCLGSLEVRLAQNTIDVLNAQKLRYQVFYEEKSAIGDAVMHAAQCDADVFDMFSDHLIVVDHASSQGGRTEPLVVGTYRLLRQSVAEKHEGFYSAREFDICKLLSRCPTLRFLELGRSCVLQRYRTRSTLQLLWHGIWRYVLHHSIDVLFGCASIDGIDPVQLALPLSFLHHYAAAPEFLRVSALPHRYVEMNRIGKSAIDQNAALSVLPPLLNGYLKLGAYVGDGAVVDLQFGTTDILMVLPVSRIDGRYIRYFGGLGR
jgi:L-ornithine Nalpha-acyltransferase